MEHAQLLEKLLEKINTTVFNASVVDSKSRAKDDCIECIKTMNELLALPPDRICDKDKLRAISSYLMNLYSAIAENKMGVQERFQWLSSRRKGIFYYPVVTFSSNYDSLNAWDDLIPRNSEDSRLVQLEVPSEYTFKHKEITNWSVDGTTLLYQDLLNNCSYVSSFLSIAENDTAISKLNNCVAPRASSSLYRVRLFFNGCDRIVLVDNLLPFPKITDNRHRQIIISSIAPNDLYWPALVEKAYLQLLLDHGYSDFQGSNMATDTYMLIGWVPEVVRIHQDILEENIMTHFRNGEVLLGLGTGNLTDKVSKDLNLVSNHDYAIMSIAEDANSLLLKNSWLNQRNLTINGLSNFKYLYINWNPKVFFSYKSTITFKFQSCAAFGDSQQFLLYNNTLKEQAVWLLLERHLIDNDSLREDSNDIWINVNMYDSGTKLLSKSDHLNVTNNREINNRLCLLKFVLEPSKKYIVVPECSESFLFSLHMFNNISPEFKFEKAAYAKPFTKEIVGTWDTTNRGGPYNISSYINNPQFSLSITEKTNADVALFAGDPAMHVNFHMFYCGQDPITTGIREFDPKSLLHHGSYEQNSAITSFKDLEVGYYRVVVSNFENVTGKFKLVINSDTTVIPTKIPTSLGLFLRQCNFDWNNSSRHKLLLSTTDYNNKIRLRLHNYLCSTVTESLQYRPSVRASLFNKFTSQRVFVNETWNNSLYGVFYDWNIESPGEFILLVELQHASDFHCQVSIGNNKDVSLTELRK